MTRKPRNILKSLKVKDFLQTNTFSTESESTERYSLQEFFSQRPGINADIDQIYTTEVARACNLNFEVVGTNSTTALATFSATSAGIVLTTAGADNDQMIVCPHLDTAVTAWASVKWGTENQTIWESAITVGPDITNGVLLWAGLKLTNTPTIITNTDQAFFRFSTDDADTTWRLISSIGGVDTNTDSGLTVAINTIYRLKIKIDSDRKAYFFINDKLYHITAALTNDKDFIPYVGIQALNGAAEYCTLHYEKISRVLFE